MSFDGRQINIPTPDLSGITEHIQARNSEQSAAAQAQVGSERALKAVLGQLHEAAAVAQAAEERENTMLWWTRVSGIAAVLAAVLSLAAVIVAVVLA